MSKRLLEHPLLVQLATDCSTIATPQLSRHTPFLRNAGIRCRQHHASLLLRLHHEAMKSVDFSHL